MSNVQRHVTDDEVRAWLANQFFGAAARTAADLRALADTIEVRAAQIRRVPMTGTAGSIAARIVSDVTGGLANAGLDAIVSAATTYDAKTTAADRTAPASIVHQPGG